MSFSTSKIPSFFRTTARPKLAPDGKSTAPGSKIQTTGRRFFSFAKLKQIRKPTVARVQPSNLGQIKAPGLSPGLRPENFKVAAELAKDGDVFKAEVLARPVQGKELQHSSLPLPQNDTRLPSIKELYNQDTGDIFGSSDTDSEVDLPTGSAQETVEPEESERRSGKTPTKALAPAPYVADPVKQTIDMLERIKSNIIELSRMLGGENTIKTNNLDEMISFMNQQDASQVLFSNNETAQKKREDLIDLLDKCNTLFEELNTYVTTKKPWFGQLKVILGKLFVAKSKVKSQFDVVAKNLELTPGKKDASHESDKKNNMPKALEKVRTTDEKSAEFVNIVSGITVGINLLKRVLAYTYRE